MDAFAYLTNAELVRAIDTTKNYVRIDTRYSCNHVASKNTFTNQLVGENLEEVLYIDLACDETGLHYHLRNLYDRIYRGWGFHCYHYGTMETMVTESYHLTMNQFLKLKKYIES